MASVSRESPALFLRNATGLVKGWSGFDAFTYSFMAVNLVTLGMFYSLAVFAYVPGASPVLSIAAVRGRRDIPGRGVRRPRRGHAAGPAATTSGRAGSSTASRGSLPAPCLFGVAAYLVAQAAGLDGTVQLVAGVVGLVVGGWIGSLRGGIGFVLAATGWWFILALWAPIYGAILKLEFFQPLAALIGSADLATFFASDTGTLIVSIIVIVLTSGLVALGMAGYARIQRWCLYAGLAGFAIMAVLMLISTQTDFQTAFDRAASSLFGVSGAYQKTIADAATNDAFTGSLGVLDLGANFGDTLTATLAMIPLMLFWILYPNWGATLYGEVRGSGDFNKVLRGMLGGIWVTAILAIVFLLLAAKTFGWLFFNATNVNFINYFYGYTTTAADGADLELPAAARVVPHRQHDLPDRDGRPVRGLVPGLVRDAVPVVDADDLRGGVRPGPARERRARLRGPRRPGRGACSTS